MTAVTRRTALLAAPALILAAQARAQTPSEAVHVAESFRFHTGETLSGLRLAYTTMGERGAPAVLLLHGTGGSARSLLQPAFAGELFGPGQPLDASRHFLILPDSLGHGRSAKPSDGLRARFPRYNLADTVEGHRRVVADALGVGRMRLVLGNSMGGMQAWLWGVTHPDAMEKVVPMASQPTAMSGRNWMLRRLMIETVRQDPAHMGGNYTAPPPSLRLASVFYATATNGGDLALQAAAPTAARADAVVEQRLAAPPPPDANDFVWQWDCTRDYDPSPHLERIRARVLAINSADDERNPPATGLTEAALRRIPDARLHLIAASAETQGHGTTGQARFWREELRRFLAEG
jgi:homoserine O-acetyltransferase